MAIVVSPSLHARVPTHQGILTSDVFRLEHTGSPLVYSCLLTPNGRFLHDLFISQTEGPEPALLADVDQGGKAELLKSFQSYVLHHQVCHGRSIALTASPMLGCARLLPTAAPAGLAGRDSGCVQQPLCAGQVWEGGRLR